MLRHRTLIPTIYLSEVARKPFALSQTFFLSSGGKNILLAKEKASSHSDFPLSTYVVLKTRHANPNIHVRRFIVHVRSPNFSASRPQLLSLRGATTYYGFILQTNSDSHRIPLLVYHPIHRDPVTKRYKHSAYTYSKARYAELYSLPDKGRKPSASPLTRAGAWRYLNRAEEL